ncbi:hypothetical protein QJ857_gp1245 [Tupanvirus soda lake]|uniref:F-box domain-containing protein n=2 Tax=Tupanvirus TaxID=2094720 RepID=A0A6N1NTD9_9VIRU|nr:hypothetical protein QJ857_gp1245 [Tupanvirus soda lake]QKU34813.1 hypothetical protein [Tupanvirus soda lake]
MNITLDKLLLYQLKKLDINCFYLNFVKDGKTNYLNCDTLLHIISYLDIKEIIKLSKVCKLFYGLCRSNYIWGPRLFSVQDNVPPSEKMMKIIYEKNKSHFPNYLCFRNYFSIYYFLNGNPNKYNYFDMFSNIVHLASDMRAPYYHNEIIPDIRNIYNKLIEDGNVHDEFIYIVKAVNIIPEYENNQCIWKYQKITEDSEFLLVLRKSKTNKIKFHKFVRPFKVPTDIIKKTKVIMFSETIDRLFNR